MPRASVGASAGAPDEVRITIAWELSWYQWGVDIADELRPVFELDKGGEVDQIDAAAQQWNAAVGEDGRLRLAGEAGAEPMSRAIVNVDGGARGNPGPAAIGVVVRDAEGACSRSWGRRSARRPTTSPSTGRC